MSPLESASKQVQAARLGSLADLEIPESQPVE